MRKPFIRYETIATRDVQNILTRAYVDDPKLVMRKRVELLATYYYDQVKKMWQRRGIPPSNHEVRSDVFLTIFNWVGERNDICHQPGYLKNINLPAFADRTMFVTTLLHEMSDCLEGKEVEYFSILS